MGLFRPIVPSVGQSLHHKQAKFHRGIRMAISTRVRLSDMRKVYRLVGEIVEMGGRSRFMANASGVETLRAFPILN